MIRGLADCVRLVASRRRVLLRTTATEIKRRYAGSAMGLLWIGIGPVLLMLLHAAVYGAVLRISPPGMTREEYVLHMLAGLLPFLGCSEALAAGTLSLKAHRDVLLSTVFPAELVPLRAVLVAMAAPAVGLVLVAVADAVLARPSAWLLCVPIVLFLLAMFVTGVVWLTSLANLVAQDIQLLLPYVSIVLLLASPIAYTPDMLPDGLVRAVWLNPISVFVVATQSLIVQDAFPPWPVALGCVALGLGSFMLGWRIFQRAKRAMLDHA